MSGALSIFLFIMGIIAVFAGQTLAAALFLLLGLIAQAQDER